MFRRRYRRQGGIFRGILALVIFSIIFSGGIGALFATFRKGPIIDSSSISFTDPSSKGTENSPVIPNINDDTSSLPEIEISSPEETAPKVEEIKEIEPNEQNSLTVKHHENKRFEGKVTKGTTTTFKFTAPVTGKYWLTFEKVYAGDSFDIKVIDPYGNDKAFFSSSSYVGGGNADLDKNVEYTIAIEDYYGNNKHNTFAVVVMIPDETVVISPEKVFIYDDIRYTNQVLEYSFTPAESGLYCLSYECSNKAHLDNVAFINDYDYAIGSIAYGSKKGTAKSELGAGHSYRIRIINAGEYTQTGKIKLKLTKEDAYENND